VIPTTKNGGAEDVVLRWAAEASRRGHEVFVYTFLPTDQIAEVPVAVSHIHRSFTSRVGRWISLPLWIRARAREDRLEVLVSALTHANLAALIGLKLAGPTHTSVIISEHNLPSVLLPLDRRRARVKLWLLRRLYRYPEAAVAVSHPVAAELVSRFRVAPDRLAVVPNPVLDAPVAAVSRSPERAHVAFVGRLVPQKAPHLFVDTLAELANRGIAVRATVVGDGPLRDDVAAAAQRAGVPVRFTGWRSRWQDEVQDCDCLLLPSEVEGFGNVLIEAAAAGIPSVVRSSALGVADAVIPGVTGELVAWGTPEALAAGVLRAITAPTGDPIAAWLRRFTTQSSADVLLELIGRVTAHQASIPLAGSASDVLRSRPAA
jgi:glycosyltransferase involved in cell wall biosynthesis